MMIEMLKTFKPGTAKELEKNKKEGKNKNSLPSLFPYACYVSFINGRIALTEGIIAANIEAIIR